MLQILEEEIWISPKPLAAAQCVASAQLRSQSNIAGFAEKSTEYYTRYVARRELSRMLMTHAPVSLISSARSSVSVILDRSQ